MTIVLNNLKKCFHHNNQEREGGEGQTDKWMTSRLQTDRPRNREKRKGIIPSHLPGFHSSTVQYHQSFELNNASLTSSAASMLVPQLIEIPLAP